MPAAGMEKPRDVVGGLLVVAIGAGFLLVGRDLEMGSSFRMGPGYFPTILSGLMMFLGAVMTVLAARRPAEEGSFVGYVPWLGVLLVVGSVVFFGLTLRGIGLAPAVALVVLATAWASRYASWRASVPLALGLTLFCVALFVRGLGLPLPVVGPWSNPPPAAAPPAPAPAGVPAPATPPGQ